MAAGLGRIKPEWGDVGVFKEFVRRLRTNAIPYFPGSGPKTLTQRRMGIGKCRGLEKIVYCNHHEHRTYPQKPPPQDPTADLRPWSYGDPRGGRFLMSEVTL